MKIFCEMLGIEYPIIQGAMAWIATPELVAAVSNAGGLGVLATGHLNGEGCREAIHKLKRNDRPSLCSEYYVIIYLCRRDCKSAL